MTPLTCMKHIGNIITTYMDYTSSQVFLWNQKYNIPSDDKVYVAIGSMSNKIMSNKALYFHETGREAVITNHSMSLSINVFSKSIAAINDKDEIVMALRSSYSQEVQHMYGFYIASKPVINTINEEEGASVIYRFNISVPVYYANNEIKSIEYYEHFHDAQINGG